MMKKRDDKKNEKPAKLRSSLVSLESLHSEDCMRSGGFHWPDCSGRIISANQTLPRQIQIKINIFCRATSNISSVSKFSVIGSHVYQFAATYLQYLIYTLAFKH